MKKRISFLPGMKIIGKSPLAWAGYIASIVSNQFISFISTSLTFEPGRYSAECIGLYTSSPALFILQYFNLTFLSVPYAVKLLQALDKLDILCWVYMGSI